MQNTSATALDTLTAEMPSMAESTPLLKLRDPVRILHSGNLRGRIVELRGPLGPGGA
jgi:hypothetical protein